MTDFDLLDADIQKHLLDILLYDEAGRIHSALRFADENHAGTHRDYGGVPYIHHPINVAVQVYLWGGSADQIIAALLHDLIEDVDWINDSAIEEKFGSNVSRMVSELTNPSIVGIDGNRKRRKSIDADHVSRGGSDTKLIKKADIKDNTKDKHLYAPKKSAKGYYLEKWVELHAIWTPESNKAFTEVAEQIQEAAKLIGLPLPSLKKPHKVIIPEA